MALSPYSGTQEQRPARERARPGPLRPVACREDRKAPGLDRAEVLVGGEGLRLGPEELLATLLHEVEHGLGTAARRARQVEMAAI